METRLLANPAKLSQAFESTKPKKSKIIPTDLLTKEEIAFLDNFKCEKRGQSPLAELNLSVRPSHEILAHPSGIRVDWLRFSQLASEEILRQEQGLLQGRVHHSLPGTLFRYDGEVYNSAVELMRHLVLESAIDNISCRYDNKLGITVYDAEEPFLVEYKVRSFDTYEKAADFLKSRFVEKNIPGTFWQDRGAWCLRNEVGKVEKFTRQTEFKQRLKYFGLFQWWQEPATKRIYYRDRNNKVQNPRNKQELKKLIEQDQAFIEASYETPESRVVKVGKVLLFTTVFGSLISSAGAPILTAHAEQVSRKTDRLARDSFEQNQEISTVQEGESVCAEEILTTRQTKILSAAEQKLVEARYPELQPGQRTHRVCAAPAEDGTILRVESVAKTDALGKTEAFSMATRHLPDGTPILFPVTKPSQSQQTSRVLAASPVRPEIIPSPTLAHALPDCFQVSAARETAALLPAVEVPSNSRIGRLFQGVMDFGRSLFRQVDDFSLLPGAAAAEVPRVKGSAENSELVFAEPKYIFSSTPLAMTLSQEQSIPAYEEMLANAKSVEEKRIALRELAAFFMPLTEKSDNAKSKFIRYASELGTLPNPALQDLQKYAQALFFSHEIPKALRILELLNKTEPHNVLTLFWLSRCYQEVKEFAKAETHYKQCLLSANQKDFLPAVFNNLGLVHFDQKHYEEAIPLFLKAIELGVKEAYKNIAECYGMMKKSDLAGYYAKEAAKYGSDIDLTYYQNPNFHNVQRIIKEFDQLLEAGLYSRSSLLSILESNLATLQDIYPSEHAIMLKSEVAISDNLPWSSVRVADPVTGITAFIFGPTRRSHTVSTENNLLRFNGNTVNDDSFQGFDIYIFDKNGKQLSIFDPEVQKVLGLTFPEASDYVSAFGQESIEAAPMFREAPRDVFPTISRWYDNPENRLAFLQKRMKYHFHDLSVSEIAHMQLPELAKVIKPKVAEQCFAYEVPPEMLASFNENFIPGVNRATENPVVIKAADKVILCTLKPGYTFMPLIKDGKTILTAQKLTGENTAVLGEEAPFYVTVISKTGELMKPPASLETYELVAPKVTARLRALPVNCRKLATALEANDLARVKMILFSSDYDAFDFNNHQVCSLIIDAFLKTNRDVFEHIREAPIEVWPSLMNLVFDYEAGFTGISNFLSKVKRESPAQFFEISKKVLAAFSRVTLPMQISMTEIREYLAKPDSDPALLPALKQLTKAKPEPEKAKELATLVKLEQPELTAQTTAFLRDVEDQRVPGLGEKLAGVSEFVWPEVELVFKGEVLKGIENLALKVRQKLISKEESLAAIAQLYPALGAELNSFEPISWQVAALLFLAEHDRPAAKKELVGILTVNPSFQLPNSSIQTLFAEIERDKKVAAFNQKYPGIELELAENPEDFWPGIELMHQGKTWESIQFFENLAKTPNFAVKANELKEKAIDAYGRRAYQTREAAPTIAAVGLPSLIIAGGLILKARKNKKARAAKLAAWQPILNNLVQVTGATWQVSAKELTLSLPIPGTTNLPVPESCRIPHLPAFIPISNEELLNQIQRELAENPAFKLVRTANGIKIIPKVMPASGTVFTLETFVSSFVKSSPAYVAAERQNQAENYLETTLRPLFPVFDLRIIPTDATWENVNFELFIPPILTIKIPGTEQEATVPKAAALGIIQEQFAPAVAMLRRRGAAQSAGTPSIAASARGLTIQGQPQIRNLAGLGASIRDAFLAASPEYPIYLENQKRTSFTANFLDKLLPLSFLQWQFTRGMPTDREISFTLSINPDWRFLYDSNGEFRDITAGIINAIQRACARIGTINTASRTNDLVLTIPHEAVNLGLPVKSFVDQIEAELRRNFPDNYPFTYKKQPFERFYNMVQANRSRLTADSSLAGVGGMSLASPSPLSGGLSHAEALSFLETIGSAAAASPPDKAEIGFSAPPAPVSLPVPRRVSPSPMAAVSPPPGVMLPIPTWVNLSIPEGLPLQSEDLPAGDVNADANAIIAAVTALQQRKAVINPVQIVQSYFAAIQHVKLSDDLASTYFDAFINGFLPKIDERELVALEPSRDIDPAKPSVSVLAFRPDAANLTEAEGEIQDLARLFGRLNIQAGDDLATLERKSGNSNLLSAEIQYRLIRFFSAFLPLDQSLPSAQYLRRRVASHLRTLLVHHFYRFTPESLVQFSSKLMREFSLNQPRNLLSCLRDGMSAGDSLTLENFRGILPPEALNLDLLPACNLSKSDLLAHLQAKLAFLRRDPAIVPERISSFCGILIQISDLCSLILEKRDRSNPRQNMALARLRHAIADVRNRAAHDSGNQVINPLELQRAIEACCATNVA